MGRFKISITLNSQPLSGDFLDILSSGGSQLFSFNFWEDPATPPLINPVEIDSEITYTTVNLHARFINSYNLDRLYDSSQIGSNLIEIEGDWDSPPYNSVGSSSSISVVVSSEVEILKVELDNLVQNSSSQCNLIAAEISTSRDIIEITKPTSIIVTPGKNFTVPDLPRNTDILLEVKSADGEYAQINFYSGGSLNSGLINIDKYSNSITITNNTNGLELEYSLNGADWQTESVFTELLEQNYFLQARDIYGCTALIPFTIETGSIIVPDPASDDYFSYPKSNSIRMSIIEDWDNCTINKNDKNTLSCDAIDDVKYKELQTYRSCDKITLQFKNNYSDLVIRTTDNSEIISLNQKTNNRDIKESMDAKTKQIDGTRVGVYFVSGNTYDYDSGVINGDYSLNGDLPNWVKIGGIIEIGSIVYLISDLYFDDVLGYNMAVLYTQMTDSDKIIKTQYNNFRYDVYECIIDMAGRTTLQISVYFDGSIKMLSETIKIDDYVTNLALIRYSMPYNTDMFFASGIEPIIRFLIDTSQAGGENESDNYITDVDVDQTKSSNYEIEVIRLLPLTKEVARLAMLIFSHKNININGIDYTKKEIEIESQGRSNLYVVTGTFYVRESGLGRNEFGVDNIEIPELLSINNEEFIKL